MKYVLLAFLAYLLYKLVFNFIIPVYRASRKIKARFREMQEEINARQHPTTPTNGYSPSQGGNNSAASPQKDYIDFEEIK